VSARGGGKRRARARARAALDEAALRALDDVEKKRARGREQRAAGEKSERAGRRHLRDEARGTARANRPNRVSVRPAGHVR